MNNKFEFFENCVIIDYETSGLDFRTAEIIEWGTAEWSPNGTWETASSFCEASEPIDPEVSAITNITDEMVAGSGPFTSHLNIFDFYSDKYADGYYIAHNSFYDSKVLENYKKYPNKWICTLRMAKKLFGNDPTVTKMNLPYLRYRFKLDIPEEYQTAHRADADAYITGMLLEFFIEEMENRGILDKDLPYGDQIIEWLEAPVINTIMTFGKHKGKQMSEVPLSYWKWALENMETLNEDADEFDPDFAASVAKALGAD